MRVRSEAAQGSHKERPSEMVAQEGQENIREKRVGRSPSAPFQKGTGLNSTNRWLRSCNPNNSSNFGNVNYNNGNPNNNNASNSQAVFP